MTDVKADIEIRPFKTRPFGLLEVELFGVFVDGREEAVCARYGDACDYAAEILMQKCHDAYEPKDEGHQEEVGAGPEEEAEGNKP